MIHQAAREMAVARIGAAEWDRLAAANGLTDGHFIGFDYYDDAQTGTIVQILAERLGLPRDAALAEFGRHWIEFAGRSAHGRVLDLAGDDLETFLGNLDRIHASIKSNMPRAEMPSFQILSVAPDQIRLLYCSCRSGLAPFVAGILAAIAERFRETVDISHAPHGEGVEFVLARRPADAPA